MEKSLIHELLSPKFFKYREELEKEENNFTEWIKESREALENSLSNEQLKLVDNYKNHLALREEDIELQIEIKMLNLGIKIGMQLQKFFDIEWN